MSVSPSATTLSQNSGSRNVWLLMTGMDTAFFTAWEAYSVQPWG